MIQLVLRQQNQEDLSAASKEAARRNLQELLVQQASGSPDPLAAWRMSVFGSEGAAGSVLQCKELSRQDKVSLLRLGVGKHLLDPETEARLLATEPRLDLELADPYKASTITFKFVAFKTGLAAPPVLPHKIHLTFKFFTFASV